MKKLPLFIIKYVLLLLCLPAAIPVQAQNIHAIDIEKATNAWPHNNMFSVLNMFAELNGVFYFNANDGIHGSELYRSDGTTAGTWLVKDINLGFASSNADDIIVSGNKIYFSASDGSNGRELWVSDGTATGTQMVMDIRSGSLDANPSYLTDVNGTLYFVTDFLYNNSRDQLWKTDGTATGTSMVADFSSFNPFYGGNARYLTNVNGKLFFTLNSYFYNPQLYATDGTTSGTNLVKSINPFGQDNPSNLTVLNGLLYFAAQDESGVHLWVSDGTDAGTHAVNNSNNITLPSYYYDDNERPFAIIGKTLFFQGYTDAKGNELCKYNTAIPANNLRLVKDITPGTAGSYSSNMANVNGTLFFNTYPTGADAELWKTDGSAAGTVLVKDINPGGTNGYYGFVGMDSILMFAYYNDALGFELWKSDGTDAGTVLVKDIAAGIYTSFPQYLTYKNNTFLLGAYNDSKGLELWKSDGTTTGTLLVKDINQSTTASSYPYNFIASPANKNKALFRAGNNKYGFELWESNGYSMGTKVMEDIFPGSASTYPQHLINFKGETYFFASKNEDYFLGKTDGTDAGTSLFYQLNISGYVQDVTASADLLYFTVLNFTTSKQEIWRSDGTAAGTGIVKSDIDPYFSMHPTGAGQYLFFVNSDGDHGLELWKSDGTNAGTTIVKDIYPGYGGSYPFNLYNFNNKLYFAADYGYGPFLWTSDGTNAGTKIIKAAVVQSIAPFAQANGKLFFDAYSTIANGYELYATDGTGAGTKLVRDINSGPASSLPFALVNGDTLLYFMADDGKHGQELWVSDGGKTGTHLVKNITPGINSTSLSYMVNVSDKLFFTMNDTLWQSDATKEGTHKVQDPELDGVSNIYGLTRVGDWLYFSAFSKPKGQELYTANATGFFTTNNFIVQQKITAQTKDNVFEVKLLTNPIANQLRLLVNSKTAQAAHITITDAGGRIIKMANQNLLPGATVLSYDADNWAQGMYIIKLTAANGLSVTLKVVR